jgi:HK97 gp10 family phage protein
MAYEFHIDGLDDLLKSMDGMPLVLQKKLIVEALREGSEPVQEQMAILAPDDPDTAGSRIRENIDVSIAERTADGAVAYIGPTKAGFVGGFAEFGTAHQTATPFIGPAFDEKVEEATQIIGEVLGDGIEKALKQ